MEELLKRAKILVPAKIEKIKATWLLSGDIGAPVWETRNGGREELVDGKWEKTINVYFDALMSDGTRLCSPENKLILDTVQVWAYSLRAKWTGSSLGPRRWLDTVRWGINLASWVLLHKNRFAPKEEAFKYFDKNAAQQLLSELALGGWCEALQFIPRSLVHLYTEAFGECPGEELISSPYELPESVKEKISEYLVRNGAYVDNGGGMSVSRRYFSDVLGASLTSFKSDSFRVFARQFEPGLDHPHLLLESCLDTVFPSQNTPLKIDVINRMVSEETLSAHAGCLEKFLLGRSFLPERYASGSFDVELIHAGLKSIVRRSGHHNLLPLSTGLSVLNAVVTWVFSCGDAIVEAAVYVVGKYEKIRRSNCGAAEAEVQKEKAVSFAVENWKIKSADGSDLESLKEKFGLMPLNKRVKREEIYKSPSFYLILQALVGACALSIAIMKPSRDEEIQRLKRNCLARGSGLLEGYWLDYELGKSGESGLNRSDKKPIPFLTAKAISLLQKLGEKLSVFYGDETAHAVDLFYFPSGATLHRPSDSNLGGRINSCIDVFCDFSETPLDEYGRRWYVRFHELRKFFLIMFFWDGKYHVLDAVRWMAGHTQAEHTYAYIEANMPGEELSRIEAEYVDERLIMLERNEISRGGNEGLVALYDCVCEHFGVRSIEGVRGEEYLCFLEELRADNKYSVKPYSIFSRDGGGEVSGIEIAVKFLGAKDEKYNDI
ncbi:hypothetical protein [Geopseudomonas sagittaria]|uniref:hypothetical protein n=1 Tax=Geopseudomonas sagittaria TaxID=1135990 RepID=UPI00158750F7|nr:hypothetical protein [Pseudomonas sagittaria]